MTRLIDIRKIFTLLGVLAIFAVSAPTTAPAQSDEDVYRENTEINQMFHKLGRGISNVLLGWVEIPKNVAEGWRETEPFTGTIVGTVKGVGWAVARTVAGFYEVVSFPFPVPRGYQPIMHPEFVLPSVWGERLPIYEDEFLQGETAATPALTTGTEIPTYGDAFPEYGVAREY